MVLPIGFFAPLPLPMMIPFMGIQSAVMAEQFGTMFQYGKRRISAMSNEEFNALTPEKLQQRMTTQLEGMVPEMEKQIQAMRPLIAIILREFGSYIGEAADAMSHAIGGPHLIPHADNLLSTTEWEKQQVENLQTTTTTIPTTTTTTKDIVPIIESTTVTKDGEGTYPDYAKDWEFPKVGMTYAENMIQLYKDMNQTWVSLSIQLKRMYFYLKQYKEEGNREKIIFYQQQVDRLTQEMLVLSEKIQHFATNYPKYVT